MAWESSAALLHELAAVLLKLQIMSTPQSRATFLRELSAYGGPTDIPHGDVARAHVVEIVHACRDHPRGLMALEEAIRSLAPSHWATTRVSAIIAELSVLTVIDPEELARAEKLLAQAVPVDVPSLWYASADQLAALPDRPPRGTIDAFRQLTGLTARPDGLPPVLAFIEHVAACQPHKIAVPLRLWNDSQAARLDLSSELAAVRTTAAAGPPPTASPPTLVVQLEELPIDARRYVLTHWVNHHPGRWSPEPGEPMTVPREQVHGAIATLVLRAETLWSTRPGPANLQFVLPTTLLNESVDWWPTEPGAPDAVPLCIEYPVVIRSLERMRTRSHHRVWRSRWEQMLAAASIRALWALRDDDDLTQWNALLRGDLTYTAVILGNPPTAAHLRRMKMAVRAGVPVILWDRREQRAADFPDVINAVISGGPMSMDERVRDLRRAAMAADGTAGHTHIGRYLAVLWDDPDSLVDIPPFGPFGADGDVREIFDRER